jgi:hypothetical protein
MVKVKKKIGTSINVLPEETLMSSTKASFKRHSQGLGF